MRSEKPILSPALSQMSYIGENLLPPSLKLQQGQIAGYLLDCWNIEGADSLLSSQYGDLDVTVSHGSSVVQSSSVNGPPVILDSLTFTILLDYVVSTLVPEVIGAIIFAVLFGGSCTRGIHCSFRASFQDCPYGPVSSHYITCSGNIKIHSLT